jgi:hypothetical protein
MNAWIQTHYPLWSLAAWTMLHYLWLGALVAAAGAAIRLASRHAGPDKRYAISLATLTALAVLPMAIAAWLETQGGGGGFWGG